MLIADRGVSRRKQLASQGISNPEDLALWARRRGLLSVYLQFVSAPSSKSYWQVVRPGYATDPTDVQHQGNKTFLAADLSERLLSLQDAITWLSINFGVSTWVAVAGFPNVLFPQDTAKALREVCPSIMISNSKGRLTLSKSL